LVHSPAAAHAGHRSSPSAHSPPHLAAWNSVDLPNSPTWICEHHSRGFIGRIVDDIRDCIEEAAAPMCAYRLTGQSRRCKAARDAGHVTA